MSNTCGNRTLRYVSLEQRILVPFGMCPTLKAVSCSPGKNEVITIREGINERLATAADEASSGPRIMNHNGREGRGNTAADTDLTRSEYAELTIMKRRDIHRMAPSTNILLQE